jgi:uncharacterized protein
MQVNVSQLLQEPIGAIRDYQVDGFVHDIGDGKGYKVRGECQLLRTQRSVLARCMLNTEVELTCSRCLSQFLYQMTLNFEEEYLPTVDAVSGAPLPLPEEASTFTIDEHHILDLTEAIRQYTLLAVPMKPLCREECAGLCQNCGKNLNQGTCDCPAQNLDPRWSKLTKLQ